MDTEPEAANNICYVTSFLPLISSTYNIFVITAGKACMLIYNVNENEINVMVWYMHAYRVLQMCTHAHCF